MPKAGSWYALLAKNEDRKTGIDADATGTIWAWAGPLILQDAKLTRPKTLERRAMGTGAAALGGEGLLSLCGSFSTVGMFHGGHANVLTSGADLPMLDAVRKRNHLALKFRAYPSRHRHGITEINDSLPQLREFRFGRERWGAGGRSSCR